MAIADEFARASAVLSELTPDVDIRGIELRRNEDGNRIVTLQTRTPGQLIGRQGATANALRAALAERFADDHLQLNIAEVPDDPPPDRRPPDGPGVLYPPS